MRYLLLSLSLVYASCTSDTSTPSEPIMEITEVYQTERDRNDNVDTPAIWDNPNGETWLLATAKETDRILVYNASTGETIGRFGEEGDQMGQLDRPNAITVVDDFALVVERDNKRVQVFRLPELESLGFFGQDFMVKPYGITVIPFDSLRYRLYVTDNYETPDEQVPPIAELDKRVHEFRISLINNELDSEHIQAFGDTTSEGALRKVESIMADPVYNRLLIADEDSIQNHLKVYSIDGTFTGELVGEGLFRFEPEGIALYECPDNQGYWITTDQDPDYNTFFVFDRETLRHLGGFKNTQTTNTDGIVVHQRGFTNFPNGGFFPIHNDGNISAFRWDSIASALQLDICTF